MRTAYPTDREAATPDYVLAVIRDKQRQYCQYELDADEELRFETTISDWRDASELMFGDADWIEHALALDTDWRLNLPLSEWEPVLEPASSRTLHDVCTFIAAHGARERIRPATLLGITCSTAGAFLTIRSILASHGADVSDVRPSTPLNAYARLHSEVFLGSLSALAPGKIPAVTMTHPGYDRCVGGYVLGFIATFILAALSLPWFALMAAALTRSFYLGMDVFARRGPRRVTFGSLRTFGDLARVLAEE